MSEWHGAEEIPFESIGMNSDNWDLLDELAGNSDYWEKAFHFVKQIRYRGPSSLSDSQTDWLHNIIASLGVEVNRREAKEAFKDGTY